MTAIKVATTGRTMAAAGAIWIVSVLLAIPDLVGANVRPCPTCNPTMLICDPYPPDWPDWYYDWFRPVFQFVVFFLIPITVIAVLYAGIARVLIGQSSAVNEPLATSAAKGVNRKAVAKQAASRRRVAKLVLAFVVIFVACWLPRHLFVLIYRFADPVFDDGWNAFKMIGFCLMFAYSCVNPLALYWIGQEYRRYFDHYLCGLCCRSRRLTLKDRHRETASDICTQQWRISTSAMTPNVSLENLAGGGDVKIDQIRRLHLHH